MTMVHAVTPPATGHALLLWLMTSNQLRKNNILHNPMHSAMLLQSMLPALKLPPHPSVPTSITSQAGQPSPRVVTPTSSFVSTPPSNSTPPLQQQHSVMPPTSSSFLQSLLNGGPPASTSSNQIRPSQEATPPTYTKPSNHQGGLTANSTIDMTKLEHVVTKLTKKHMGINARESYQCQVCSKWFAVPPIKHLRGHLVTFKEEQRVYIDLINNNGFACLSCFFIAASPQEISEHLATNHPISHEALKNLMAASSQANSPKQSEDVPSPPPSQGRPSGVPTIIADPKEVELDNAGRVKSGKVRKQCELCGQWSNIKWFFKHMSEAHNALFCRCCREYLPIHEQEEHRRFHAEPPYMGQKIRIENGHPVIIDRKERASLTPIGSLAAWGGSSGGMVVKAIDDGTSQLISRKRKGGSR